ncbi:MAG: FecR domain-containing protein, partial [Bacteroidia bacterium]|nr:FecR domain-containing protein [Bacteroidia bacterium]
MDKSMGDNTDHIDNIDLITKVLAGEANEEEVQLLQNWKAADPSNRTLFEEYKRSWESVDNIKELSKIDLDKEWTKLESAIGDNVQDEKVIPISHTPKPSGISRVLKIAAILLIMLLPAGGVYYYITEMNVERFIAEANSTEGVLPDGSKIALNSNSMLEYEKDYGKETRKVTLEGEAYFEVEPDRAKPSIIDAGPVLIEVLGTSFYVNAIETSKDIEVIVESGEVSICKKSNTTEKLILEAGSKGVFSIESKTLTKTT